MALQIGAGIGNESKAGSMRFRKSIQRKRSDGENDLLLRLPRNAIALHSFAEIYFDVTHALLTAFEAHRAPQFFCLSSREPRGNHRHPQELLLEKRYPKRAF